MSQENVESVKTGFEAWNAGDMEGLRELYDPDVGDIETVLSLTGTGMTRRRYVCHYV
jgi:ketosteroid isomerase-like protein